MIFISAILSSVLSFAQPQRGPQDWPNFKRYEEKNAAIAEAPLLVLMGDSITDFWYDNDPDFFEKNNFAGRGISGQTASQMLARFMQDVVRLKPKAVAIMAGTNDLCQNMASQAYYPDQVIYDNIVAMCELAEAAGIKVLLCSITPCAHYMILPDIDAGSIIEAFNARLKAYADTQKNVTYVDYFTPLANAEKGLNDDSSYDGIHPAVNIYDDMERILVDALKKSLKLKKQAFYTLPSDEADRRKVAADADRKEKKQPMNFSETVEMLNRMRSGRQMQTEGGARQSGQGNPDKPNVSAGRLDFYPGFKSDAGLVTPRNVYVWLPDNYSTQKKYAVVYMSDGQNLFDAEKMFNHQEWCVDEVFGRLLGEGKIQDCIVVGVANASRTRSQEYFPQDVFDRYSPALKEYAESKRMGEEDLLGNNYLKFLVEEVKPFIDKTYSTLTDRDHTFHMGSSMGGLISTYAVAKYPEVFGGAGCLSTHSVLYITNYGAEDESIDAANQCYVDYLKATLKPNGAKIYMDRGDQTLDAQYPKYQDRLDKMFREAGWDDAHYVSKVYPGHSHVEGSWASRLEVPVLFLLGKSKEPQIESKADRSTVEFVVRDGKPILMDIYQFKDQKTEGKRPVFIYSFGGAWAMGSRIDALCNPLYDHLCEKGWVCVAIDFRLGSARGRDGKPLMTPPEGYNPFQYSIDIGVEDIYAATNWLIRHADEYNIDPGKIVISGSSAGAINSMNAEYYICTGHQIAKDNLPDGFNYAGVIPMAGAVYLTGENDTELKWEKKPCPMCFFHGSADPTVTFDVERGPARHGFGPYYVSQQLYAMDVPYMLFEYAGGDHCMALLPLKWFWNEIDSFMDRIVLGGQDIKMHSVERSSKPRTDANWLDTVRPGQYEAVNRMRGQRGAPGAPRQGAPQR